MATQIQTVVGLRSPELSPELVEPSLQPLRQQTVIQIDKDLPQLRDLPQMWDMVKYRDMTLTNGIVETRKSLKPSDKSNHQALFIVREAVANDAWGTGYLKLPRTMQIFVEFERVEHPEGLTIYSLFGTTATRQLYLTS